MRGHLARPSGSVAEIPIPTDDVAVGVRASLGVEGDILVHNYRFGIIREVCNRSLAAADPHFAVEDSGVIGDVSFIIHASCIRKNSVDARRHTSCIPFKWQRCASSIFQISNLFSVNLLLADPELPIRGDGEGFREAAFVGHGHADRYRITKIHLGRNGGDTGDRYVVKVGEEAVMQYARLQGWSCSIIVVKVRVLFLEVDECSAPSLSSKSNVSQESITSHS